MADVKDRYHRAISKAFPVTAQPNFVPDGALFRSCRSTNVHEGAAVHWHNFGFMVSFILSLRDATRRRGGVVPPFDA